MQNSFDSQLRRSQNLAKFTGGSTLVTANYTYDNASRLATVGDGTYSATYAYLANSPMIATATFKQSATTRLTTARNYDRLNRLLGISSTPSASGLISHAYLYNDANQRIRNTWTDGTYWVYTYDSLGQVTSGKRFWPEGTPVPGQQFEYGFDDIGNRTSTKSGGDADGNNLRSASYTPNLLNQYTSRTVPGGFDVSGLAPAAVNLRVKTRHLFAGQNHPPRGGLVHISFLDSFKRGLMAS